MSASESARMPVRPTLPPTLIALVTVLVTERSCLGARSAPLMLSLALFLGGAALVAASRRVVATRTALAATAGLALCCAGLSVALCAASLRAEEALVLELGSPARALARYEVQSDPVPAHDGYRMRARVQGLPHAQGSVWLETNEELERGDLVRVSGRFEPLGTTAWDVSSRMQGIWGTVRAPRVKSRELPQGPAALLRWLRDQGRQLIVPDGSDERALIAGCVLGDRRALAERGLDRLFAACGCAHMVAVSGAHIAVVSSLIGSFASRVGGRLGLRLALTLCASGVFVLLCGAPASAVRAWAMSSLAWGSTLLGRRADGLSGVCVSGLVMALIEPGLCGQMGFLLSISCVVGLQVFGNYAGFLFEQLVPRIPATRRLPAQVRRALAGRRPALAHDAGASAVAQASSAPVALPAFGRLSLVGPLANLLIAAPFNLLLAAGALALSLGWVPGVAGMLLAAADIGAWAVLALLRACARLPLACVAVECDAGLAWAALASGALVLYILWPRPSQRRLAQALGACALVGSALIVRWTCFAPARIAILDIGQGDAILVQDGAHAVLVDAGPDDAVVAALARNHVLRLDAIVLTHLHDDHVGGVADLVGAVPSDALLVARGVAGHLGPELEQARQMLGCAVEELDYGSAIRVGDFVLTMVWPRESVDGDENSESLMLAVSYVGAAGNLSALLTGDAEHDELCEVLASGDVGDIDLLKLGHHGSAVSLDLKDALALDSELAVASAGENNRYGHPRPECVEVVETSGGLFLCTKDVGDVEVRPGKEGVRLLLQHGEER